MKLLLLYKPYTTITIAIAIVIVIVTINITLLPQACCRHQFTEADVETVGHSWEEIQLTYLANLKAEVAISI